MELGRIELLGFYSDGVGGIGSDGLIIKTGSGMARQSKERPYLVVYWASSSSRPEKLSEPPGMSMDWRRLVRTSVKFLTS